MLIALQVLLKCAVLCTDFFHILDKRILGLFVFMNIHPVIQPASHPSIHSSIPLNKRYNCQLKLHRNKYQIQHISAISNDNQHKYKHLWSINTSHQYISLNTLSTALIIQYQILRFVNPHDTERNGLVCVMKLSQNLPGGTEENHNYCVSRAAGLQTEIWTHDLPDMKQESKPLNSEVFHNIRKVTVTIIKVYGSRLWQNHAVLLYQHWNTDCFSFCAVCA